MAVLACYDYVGRRVTLSESRWVDHIQLRHPETRGNDRSIETVLVSQEQVNYDRGFPDREVFYRRGALPPPDRNDSLKVVVRYVQTQDGEEEGEVTTAFAVGEIEPEERIKWAAPR